MPLIELSGESALQEFVSKPASIVTFSAHWCGPCKASKPQLEQLANTCTTVPFGIIYEDTLGDSIHTYQIRAFPTYVLFQNGSETKRVEGVNLSAVQGMADTILPTGGETLGGGGSAPLNAADARAARLAKFSAAAPPAAAPQPPTITNDQPMEDVSKATEDAKPAAASNDTDGDAEMKDANDDNETKTCIPTDPTANLDAQAVQTLESMGFTTLRAQKGLLKSNNTVEGAVAWLGEHQDDPDIDDPTTAETVTAQSYKCNECGKTLSNMANLELHANKTGHSDFSESTESVQPLTAEEKAAKIKEIKELLRLKRAEREAAEKVDDVDREKARRVMGQEMHKTREQLEIEQRKREAYLRRKEKEEYKKERARLRAELAKDKAERASQGGKLKSRLGVEGYKPDGIQYELDGGENEADEPVQKTKKLKADASKIDEYISKVSSYRAGGDGGKCLKILKLYVGNAADHPDEAKFKTIKMDNKAFKTKVKPFVGAKSLLMACGFTPNESGDALILSEDANMELLQTTKQKLEAAMIAYG